MYANGVDLKRTDEGIYEVLLDDRKVAELWNNWRSTVWNIQSNDHRVERTYDSFNLARRDLRDDPELLVLLRQVPESPRYAGSQWQQLS